MTLARGVSMVMILFLATAHAAENDLDAEVGAAYVLRDDALLSPLPNDGLVPTFLLAWTSRGEHVVHKALASISLGGLRSGPAWTFTWDDLGEVTAGASSVTLLDLRYAYARPLTEVLSVGATSTNRIEALDWAYAFTSTFSYVGDFEVGPWAELHTTGDRFAGSLEASFPLVAWLTRSPYALNDDEYMWDNRAHDAPAAIVNYIGDGAVVPPWKALAFHLRGSASYALSDTFALVVAPRADVWHWPDPLPTTELQLGLDAGLRGTF